MNDAGSPPKEIMGELPPGESFACAPMHSKLTAVMQEWTLDQEECRKFQTSVSSRSEAAIATSYSSTLTSVACDPRLLSVSVPAPLDSATSFLTPSPPRRSTSLLSLFDRCGCSSDSSTVHCLTRLSHLSLGESKSPWLRFSPLARSVKGVGARFAHVGIRGDVARKRCSTSCF